jgi:hypothetical protein
MTHLEELGCAVYGRTIPTVKTGIISWSEAEAVAASDTYFATATATSGSAVTTIEIDDENQTPTCARNVTLTSGGTAASIKAVVCTVSGFDMDGQPLTEEMPTFTADSATTVTGSKAFAKVTSVSVPAMDGSGVTVKVGAKLGLPFKLSKNTIISTYFNGTLEATPPTVAISSSVLASNTITLNSTLSGKAIEAYILI